MKKSPGVLSGAAGHQELYVNNCLSIMIHHNLDKASWVLLHLRVASY
jgi:hypothetical protein